jgi:8-oxo-dGTP pyrophosphatase MutT (NUDIX family)
MRRDNVFTGWQTDDYERLVVVATFDVANLRKRLVPESVIPEVGTPGSPEAAVAIIVDPDYESGSVLFIRRTERHGDPWSGQIALPGGRRSLSDRSFRATAIRETKEEVGVDLRDHELLGVLSPIYAQTRHMLVVPFVFQLKNHVDTLCNEEVAESFWIPLSDLTTIPVSEVTVNTQDGSMTTNAYVYHDQVIWGLTFRIIRTLLDRELIT